MSYNKLCACLTAWQPEHSDQHDNVWWFVCNCVASMVIFLPLAVSTQSRFHSARKSEFMPAEHHSKTSEYDRKMHKNNSRFLFFKFSHTFVYIFVCFFRFAWNRSRIAPSCNRNCIFVKWTMFNVQNNLISRIELQHQCWNITDERRDRYTARQHQWNRRCSTEKQINTVNHVTSRLNYLLRAII